MFYFSPTKIESKLPFIMVFGRYIRIYMDVGFLVYGCISDDAGSHRATAGRDDAMLLLLLRVQPKHTQGTPVN